MSENGSQKPADPPAEDPPAENPPAEDPPADNEAPPKKDDNALAKEALTGTGLGAFNQEE